MMNGKLPPLTAAAQGRDAEVLEALPTDKAELLIVDEADRLKTRSLEQLRDLYDRRQFGLILIGIPELKKRLARYPQFYSRADFVHPFRPLSQEEVKFILNHKWKQIGVNLQPDDFTDVEAARDHSSDHWRQFPSHSPTLHTNRAHCPDQ